MPTGFCTLGDLRRALREASLPGDLGQDKQIAVDAIVSQTEELEKTYSRFWYEPNGIDEATTIDIPTTAETRDDEHDVATHSGYVVGAYDGRDGWTTTSDTVFDSDTSDPKPKKEIRLAFGDLDDETIPAYTRITLARKDVKAINKLSVVNKDGGFDDWVASSDYDGGVGNTHRGEDYWVRINNGGVSELYLDVHAMDDDLASLSNAVYVDLDYGHEGIPRNVRRAVALRAGAAFVEDATIEIPNNATIYNIETKADEMRSRADELLEVYE